MATKLEIKFTTKMTMHYMETSIFQYGVFTPLQTDGSAYSNQATGTRPNVPMTQQGVRSCTHPGQILPSKSKTTSTAKTKPSPPLG